MSAGCVAPSSDLQRIGSGAVSERSCRPEGWLGRGLSLGAAVGTAGKVVITCYCKGLPKECMITTDCQKWEPCESDKDCRILEQ